MMHLPLHLKKQVNKHQEFCFFSAIFSFGLYKVGDRAGDVSVRGARLCRSEKGQNRPRADHRLSERRSGQPEGRALLPQEKPRGGTSVCTSFLLVPF